MNKYLVTIPYDFVQYGKLYCYVYAENCDEALELAVDSAYRCDEEHEDTDGDGTNYDYDEMIVNLDEENVEPPTPQTTAHNNNFSLNPINSKQALPDYFLEELQFV